MRIRKLKSWKDGDAGWLRDLDNDCFPDEKSYTNDEDYHWWIVLDGDEVVAYASLFVNPDGIIYLDRCGVIPPHRGKGLQRKLISARLRWAARNGHTVIKTYVSTSNVVSLNNLLQTGFSVYCVEGNFLYLKRVASK